MNNEKSPLLRAQILSALALLLFGVAFATVALLLPPQGQVADSVCWIFAQCLIYAGSALGLAGYVGLQLRRLNRPVPQRLKPDKATRPLPSAPTAPRGWGLFLCLFQFPKTAQHN